MLTSFLRRRSKKELLSDVTTSEANCCSKRDASAAATRYGLSTTHFSGGSAARLSAEALDSAASATTEASGDLIGPAQR